MQNQSAASHLALTSRESEKQVLALVEEVSCALKRLGEDSNI